MFLPFKLSVFSVFMSEDVVRVRVNLMLNSFDT